MSKIQQLDSQIANMIAAGEVVERPMGVVKELVENAIDAGGTRIVVTLTNGGMEKLSVEDNGSGMDRVDARMAFKRHATSKIRTKNDLWNIQTLGFRGEALPSIASVSKMTMVTSDGNDSVKVVMEYGEEKSFENAPCPTGTEITVEGLFYRTPARLKHMRSASYESSLIQNVINAFALSHPEISFRLINDGRDVFRTTGSGNLMEVLYQIYGRSAAENAVEVDFSDYDYHVKGCLVKPFVSRASRSSIHVFLNGRMVRDNKLYKAVIEGYEGTMPTGRFPIVVLHIEMDPHILDVNVHPSKWEVRLSKENQLTYLLKDQIHDALVGRDMSKVEEPHVIQETYYQPISFTEEEMRPVVEEPVKTVEVEKKIIEEEPPVIIKEDVPEAVEEEVLPAFPQMRVIGQYRSRMILCECEKGLAVMDQFAVSQRILYEQFLARREETPVKEDLLVPLTFHVTPDYIDRIAEINAAASQLHVIFEAFGTDTLLVRSIPVTLKEMDEEAFLQDVLDGFKEEKDIKNLDWKKIAMAAGKRSVKRNREMTMAEMQKLVNDLSLCENPYTTPYGKPVYVILDDRTLQKGLG